MHKKIKKSPLIDIPCYGALDCGFEYIKDLSLKR
jgi:hypothetical protein